MTLRARGSRSSKEASNTTDWISGYDITAQLAESGSGDKDRQKKKNKDAESGSNNSKRADDVLLLCTCESSYGPGIHHNVTELEAQFMYCKLDDYIHGVGLILGERYSL